ncbi:MAG: type II secretion system protein M, partial [Pseudomonadota bacterium]
MRDWFDALDSREQRFVAIGAVVVAIAILYGAIWMPLDNRHESLRADVDAWQQSLTDLKQVAPQLASGSGTSQTSTAGRQQTPLIIVDQTLRSRSLDRYRTRSQPVSGNGIRVEFENVAFDELVLWLGEMSNQYGLHVQAGTFAGGSRVGAGRINATLT